MRAPASDVAAIVRVTRVYIACAHLNHDPTDNAPRNLAALCQRCHMIHDAAEHRRRRWLNAYRRRALGDLLALLDVTVILRRALLAAPSPDSPLYPNDCVHSIHVLQLLLLLVHSSCETRGALTATP